MSITLFSDIDPSTIAMNGEKLHTTHAKTTLSPLILVANDSFPASC